MNMVICYWQHNNDSKEWDLMESFLVDDNGHCVTIPSTGGGSRHEYTKWMRKPLDEDEWDFEEISGRAVTMWTMDHGVMLLDINPPERNGWLSVDFCERLCKMPDWYILLYSGYQMFIGTAKEAEKYVIEKKQ